VTRRGRGLTGNRFVGVGLVLVIGVTALTWLFPTLSWWNLQNLPFQEWLLQLGQSSSSNLLIVLFFVMFFVVAASFGVLYSVDRREGEHLIQRQTRDVQNIIQKVVVDIQDLEKSQKK
jgi:hypothetical protein